MDFFQHYASNTLAGSGNQQFFVPENPHKIYKSRTFYKVFCGGTYKYSLLFSNIIDSTYGDGSKSHRNLILDSWMLHEARVGICSACSPACMAEPETMHALTFNGNISKPVNPGEFFSTDPVTLSPDTGDYICVELSFSGKTIPCHEESILASFIFENEQWLPSNLHPFISMLGCDRKVDAKIGFLGDSITQGIGTEVNSYTHWNSIVANNIGSRYSYWNLGLGYGRADDAATDGAWLFKAKHCDSIVLCFGVNDILKGYRAEEIKKNLLIITDTLKALGKKVVIQTVPPFDYTGANIETWNEINTYITDELSKKADMVFDCVKYLAKSPEAPYNAKYGGHPNSEGCKIWGDALSEELVSLLKR